MVLPIAALLLMSTAVAAADAPAAAADSPAGLAIGAKAPMADVKMKNVDGKDLTISRAMGEKGVLVIFTCNHCPWAQAWAGRIVEIGNAYSVKGVGVIAVNSNDPSAFADDSYDVMQKRASEQGMKFPYVVDATSGVARAFGATRTPEAFLFDRGGKLVYHGTIDDNARDPGQVKNTYLKDALDAVLAGRDVPLKETKALGCSIKFRS